jgi:integrase/recombinase XerD
VAQLRIAVASFLTELGVISRPKTVAHYRSPLTRFVNQCGPEKELSAISRDDLIAFMSLMRAEGYKNRTTFNYASRLKAFLRKHDIRFDDVRLPKFSEPIPDAYSLKEVRLLISACKKPREKLVIEFFLGSGCREGEVSHLLWSDLDFERRTVRVQAKPEFDWSPKTHEIRDIPLPDSLLSALMPFSGHGLVFPNRDSRPNGHFLKLVKRLARDSGLPEEKCSLHKFRRSFATWHHESGVSANTIKNWLGHHRLETTLRYLQAADMHSDVTRAKVNNTFATLS